MSWLSAFGGFVGKVIGAEVSGDSSAPIATVAGKTVTLGEAKNIVSASGPVLTAIVNVASGKGTVTDAETIVNAILEGVEFVDPATAPVITLVIDLEPIAVDLIQSGAIKGDPDPIHDAQTTDTPHSGRRG